MDDIEVSLDRVDARASPSGVEPRAIIDNLYPQSEAIFGAVARDLVNHGWSTFPQTTSRNPGHVKYEGIKWVHDHKLPDRLPEQKHLEEWIKHCSTLNAAVALGPGSGNAFCVDIDVTDPSLNARFIDLADEILGYTPLRRVGRAPKIALIYRYADADPVVNVQRKFVEVLEDGSVRPADQGVDILGKGKAITFYGRHHTTGRYFTWLDKSPLRTTPDEAPLVSTDQIKTWLEAVDSVHRFYRHTGGDAVNITAAWNQMGGVSIPQMRLAVGGTAWVEDRDGFVTEGREHFLFRLTMQTVTDIENQGKAVPLLVEAIVDAFKSRARCTDRWTDSFLRSNATEKVQRMIRAIQDGALTVRARRPMALQDGKKIEVKKTGGLLNPPMDHEFSFLPPPRPNETGVGRRGEWTGNIVPGPEGAAKSRAIPDDRSEALQSVRDGLTKALDSFFDDVYRDPDEAAGSRVHILKAPPGAGKTSATIRYIANDPRTKEPFLYRDGNGDLQEGRCPFVFLLPTYANIEELRTRSQILNLDASLDDAELARQAFELGIVAEDEIEARLDDLKRDALGANLTTMVYRGKIAAGCQMADKVSMAMKAGIGTAGFCKAEVKAEDGVMETVYCQHYNTCLAIAQRRQIDDCDVVFMPHPFIGLSIPEELKNVRAVIADERIHHLFLHTTMFSASALQIARKRPRLTKREYDDGLKPEELLVDRDKVADIAIRAIRERKCPAAALRGLKDPGGMPNGEKLVNSALRVCSSALQKDDAITPDLSLKEVEELCAQPAGIWIREEQRFWKIVLEKLTTLPHSELAEDRAQGIERKIDMLPENTDAVVRSGMVLKAAGLRNTFKAGDDHVDRRIQFLLTTEENGAQLESIRISWRTEPNWLGKPLLLLDASAEPEIIKKIWGGTGEKRKSDVDVVVHNIEAPRNIRVIAIADKTYSNASIVGSPALTEEKRILCASQLTRLRYAISTISALYGRGRVVAGANILVRRAINTDWAGPDNIDWCHFGAMRGLDFAKHHAAAVSIGRMEIPVQTVDGLAAALTYDDEYPEKPFDEFGNGKQADGKDIELPMVIQTVPLRNGDDALIPAPQYPSRWGRLIQKQYREEELLQFEGRLRPVYREGRAPVWFAISSVIPEGVIVDDIICLDDLLGTNPVFWDAMRLADGIIEPEVILKRTSGLNFRDKNDVVRLMNEHGLTKEKWRQSRYAEGLALFEWRREEETEWQVAFVARYAPSPVELLRSALRSAYGCDSNYQIRSADEESRSKGLRRNPDKIDIELGDREARAKGQDSILDEVFYHALKTGFKKDKTGSASGRVLTPRLNEKAGRTPADVESCVALSRMWERILNKGEIAERAELLTDDSDSYSRLGNHIQDEAGAIDIEAPL